MSSISALQSLCSLYKPSHSQIARETHSSFGLHFQKNAIFAHKYSNLRVTHKPKLSIVRSSEEEAQIPEPATGAEDDTTVATDQTVAVPVSPSDKLVMFFQAEGTMSDSAIPTVTQALEGTEGVSDLKVEISEGIASVELTKQTTIQATGVASALVEAIQGAGFKLQTLNLSFEDEELLAV